MPLQVVGVVLAAGRGERLRPLTDSRPKALCTVDGVPLVDLAIARLRPHVDAIAVNAHYLHQQMAAHLAGTGVHVSVEQPEALGTAGALGQLREWIDGRGVIVANADAWYSKPVPLSDFGCGDTMRLLVVGEPGEFGEFRYAGIAYLPWTAVRSLAPEPSGLYEVLWRDARDAGRLDLVPFDGVHIDCGTAEALDAANRAAGGAAN